jgi:hypothetical protein
VVDPVDDERNPATGLMRNRASNRVSEYLFVGSESWPLVRHQPRIGFGQPSQKASEH